MYKFSEKCSKVFREFFIKLKGFLIDVKKNVLFNFSKAGLPVLTLKLIIVVPIVTSVGWTLIDTFFLSPLVPPFDPVGIFELYKKTPNLPEPRLSFLEFYEVYLKDYLKRHNALPGDHEIQVNSKFKILGCIFGVSIILAFLTK